MIIRCRIYAAAIVRRVFVCDIETGVSSDARDSHMYDLWDSFDAERRSYRSSFILRRVISLFASYVMSCEFYFISLVDHIEDR